MSSQPFRVIHIEEPRLEFRHSQALEDPRDGLALFGPIDDGPHYGVRAGVIGTDVGVERFHRWLRAMQGPLGLETATRPRPPFPGFDTTFRVSWKVDHTPELRVDAAALAAAIRIDDRHRRVHQAVGIYADPILNFGRSEDTQVDVWFVVIPEDVYRYCRPQSHVPEAEQVMADAIVPPAIARRFARAPSLFEEWNVAAEPYRHEPHFHNQLKGRLLAKPVASQIVRETTIAFRDFTKSTGALLRDLTKMESAVAWNLGTAAFYKTGGRPWKLASVRQGVCYLGIVFKLDERSGQRDYACCAAKMFLDSGDGLVFRGALGPWYSPENHEFHLNKTAAHELMTTALNAYERKRGSLPTEVFVHGKVRFGHEEWQGFESAAGRSVKLTGVRIRNDPSIRLYRQDTNTVLRGLAYLRDERTAYLWTRGFVPRIQTYPGREVPVPLLVDVCKGQAPIETVLSDVLALTKLNYNSCIFGDGMPVTLRFAEAVGEILTAGPLQGVPPLPFKYYI